MSFKYDLNIEVKDVVTDFTGIIMGRTEYNTGCNQYGVCPRKLKKDGSTPDWHWFDETRIKPTGKKIKIVKANGGPHPTAPEM